MQGRGLHHHVEVTCCWCRARHFAVSLHRILTQDLHLYPYRIQENTNSKQLTCRNVLRCVTGFKTRLNVTLISLTMYVSAIRLTSCFLGMSTARIMYSGYTSTKRSTSEATIFSEMHSMVGHIKTRYYWTILV